MSILAPIPMVLAQRTQMQGYELSRLANLVQHIYESIYNYYRQSIQESSNKEGIDHHVHIA